MIIEPNLKTAVGETIQHLMDVPNEDNFARLFNSLDPQELINLLNHPYEFEKMLFQSNSEGNFFFVSEASQYSHFTLKRNDNSEDCFTFAFINVDGQVVPVQKTSPDQDSTIILSTGRDIESLCASILKMIREGYKMEFIIHD